MTRIVCCMPFGLCSFALPFFLVQVLACVALVSPVAAKLHVEPVAFGWYGSKAPDYSPEMVRATSQQSLLLQNIDEVAFSRGLVGKLLSSWFMESNPSMVPFQVRCSGKSRLDDMTITLDKTSVFVRCSDSFCTGGSLLAFTPIHDTLPNGLVPLLLMQQLEMTADKTHKAAVVSGSVLQGTLSHQTSHQTVTMKSALQGNDDAVKLTVPVQQAPLQFCTAGAVVAVAATSALAYGQTDTVCATDGASNYTRLLVNTELTGDIGGGDYWTFWDGSSRECETDMYFLHDRASYKVQLIKAIEGGVVSLTYEPHRQCSKGAAENILVHRVFANCLHGTAAQAGNIDAVTKYVSDCVLKECFDVTENDFRVVYLVPAQPSKQGTPYIVRSVSQADRDFREASGLCFGQWDMDILSVLETHDCTNNAMDRIPSWGRRCIGRSMMVGSTVNGSAARMASEFKDAAVAFNELYGSRSSRATILLALASAVIGSVATAGALMPVIAKYANIASKNLLPQPPKEHLWPFLSMTVFVVVLGTLGSTGPLISVIANDWGRVSATDVYALQAGVVSTDISSFNVLRHDFLWARVHVSPAILILELLALLLVVLLTGVYVATTLREAVKKATDQVWVNTLKGTAADRVVILLYSNPAIEEAGHWLKGAVIE